MSVYVFIDYDGSRSLTLARVSSLRLLRTYSMPTIKLDSGQSYQPRLSLFMSVSRSLQLTCICTRAGWLSLEAAALHACYKYNV